MLLELLENTYNSNSKYVEESFLKLTGAFAYH